MVGICFQKEKKKLFNAFDADMEFLRVLKMMLLRKSIILTKIVDKC